MIKAPYNFVPLANKVVFPEWASEISIDRPFEDGISGSIDVEYTAQTPVFIGNGKDPNVKDPKEAPVANYKAANGKYAIPGSSLRGMIRNVAEIVSFGKFNRVTVATLSIRDLQNKDKELYPNHLTAGNNNRYEALSKSGWLDFNVENKCWELYPVNYYRVEDDDLESPKVYNIPIRDKKNDKKAEERIRKIKDKVFVYFTAGKNDFHEHHQLKNGPLYLKYSKVEKIEFKKFPNAKTGYVVLTGFCGRKHMDFVFENKTDRFISLDSKIINQFNQANDSDPANQKEGLNLRIKLKKYKGFGYPGIPVFYLADSLGNPESLGLSQMYRLPYKNNLPDAIKHSSEDHYSTDMDFAECMFGKLPKEKRLSLRGRIQFEDATSDSDSFGKRVDTILESPKPAYYPNYIEQDNKEKYKTLMDSDVKLRGWKRYPVRNEPNPVAIGQGQTNVGTHFSPLQKGTVFVGKIHFHNLKKEELGLLLWAITWGNNKKLSHAVGMGKPYGYGQIKASISSLSYLKNNSQDNDYNKASDEDIKFWEDSFESYMEYKISGWKSSPQLTELRAMADPQNATRPNWNLGHLSLKNQIGKNEFVEAKKANYFLAPYSEEKQEKQLANSGGDSKSYQQPRSGFYQGKKGPSPVPQRVARSESGITNGSVQTCILLEEKTKKGGWKASIKNNSDISGPIINTGDVPVDKKGGDEIELKVAALKGANSSFKYEVNG